MQVRERHQGTRWSRAVGLSLIAHVFGAGAVWLAASDRTGVPLDLPVSAAFTGQPAEAAETGTAVELAAAEEVLPPVPQPPPELRESDAVIALQPADRTSTAGSPHAAARPGVPDDQRPSPDRGAADGRPVDQAAWRRDGSNLRDRAADGAEIDQPAHARTARLAASPQAVRRETETGIGDSPRTERAQAALPTVRYPVTEPNADGVGGDTVTAGPRESDRAEPMPLPAAARTFVASAEGPLDADRGPRSFDVERPARTATDERVTRAASTAQHPSITDLTLASVSGNGVEGRGPSDNPGALARPSAGTASAPAGARGRETAVDEAAATRARIYDRYNQEIRARVNRALIFPRALALRLEQGETFVHFVVQPDGRLGSGVRVVKSSGFAEFDQAALDAVRKASPFPPMAPRSGGLGPLGVNMGVAFSNPAVQ